MTNYPLIPDHELNFLLYQWLGLEDKLSASEHDRETIDAILHVATKTAVETFLPHNRKADIEEPSLVDGNVHILPEITKALKNYAELGFFSASFIEENGGMGLPYLAYAAAFSQFCAASIATAAYPLLTVANASLIIKFGNTAQIEQFAWPQVEGRWFGTMCLSEPQAGSSLADISTKAVASGSDEFGEVYRLKGNKMWISGADQNASENIVHLVLAKIPKADGTLTEGTKGISLFIVPKVLPDGKTNDMAIAGLNHKMGYRGTANCLLNIGENEGAVGWLVGKSGNGLTQMFHMMNEARINVGLGAAALAYRGYRHSLQYSEQRLQGRVPGVRTGKQVELFKHADVRHMLLQQKVYAEGALAICLYCASLVDGSQPGNDEEELLSLLTPVAKTWSSEYGLIANDIAIQIHGGYGYTRDFDVEQLYRDNRLNPIHEGTTGIQAQDLLGRKILKGDGKKLHILKQEIINTCEQADSLAPLLVFSDELREYCSELEKTINTLLKSDSTSVLDDATLFLKAFGHIVLAWLWLDKAVIALGQSESDYHRGKVLACQYFFETELPHCRVWLNVVTSKSKLASNLSFNQL